MSHRLLVSIVLPIVFVRLVLAGGGPVTAQQPADPQDTPPPGRD